jgi:DNA-binding CsgD family transcriptional regulator
MLAEWRRTPFYVDWCAPHGLDHDLQVKLPAPPGQALTLGLTRGRHDSDFSDRDRALLILLRPHLYTAHVAVLRRRRGIPKLTDRQWQLLRLVDAGLSNTRIARHLFIAESTVRKHLKNIFERLQFQNRTAALARAFPERALAARPDAHPNPSVLSLPAP